MKLFSAELRQLFNVRFLLVVALASIVYAYSLLTFSNESLETYLSPPDGSTTSNTDIEKHLADSVLGDGRLSVTEEDLDVLSEEMTKTEELDAFFRNTEAFRQYGVSSLEDYKKLEKEWNDAYFKETSDAPDDPTLPALQERYEQIWNIITASGKDTEIHEWLFNEKIVDSIREDYANRHEPNSYVKDVYTSESQKARLREIYEGPMDAPTFPMLLSLLTVNLTMPFTLFSYILFSFLFVTTVWKNRKQNIHYLQYTAKAGRKILRIEFLAALFAALLLLTIFLIPILCLMAQYGFFDYLALPVSGFLSSTYLWFDISVGTYFFLMVLLTYALCAGLTLLSVCISRLCRNFVACVACSLPLLAAAFLIGNRIISSSFSLYFPKFEETIFAALILLLGIAGAIFLSRREQKVDIT